MDRQVSSGFESAPETRDIRQFGLAHVAHGWTISSIDLHGRQTRSSSIPSLLPVIRSESLLFAASLVDLNNFLVGDPGEVCSLIRPPDLYRLIHFGTTRGPFVISFESTMPISTRRLAARACSLSPERAGRICQNPWCS